MPDEAPRGALAPWQIEWDAARTDLAAYHHLLTTRQSLSEREHIVPFFRAHPNLACLLGTYHPNIESYDRLGLEVASPASMSPILSLEIRPTMLFCSWS